MRRLLLALALIAAALLGAPAATATPATHRPITVQDPRVDSGQLSGVVDGVDVPSDRVHASLNGHPLRATVTPVASRTALLVIDTSGSMSGTRLHEAVGAGRAFLAAVPDDVAVGLVSIANTARVLVAPTTRRAPTLAALAHLRAGGATALYSGISRALSMAPGGEILVMTDGTDTAHTTTLGQLLAAEQVTTATVDMMQLQGPHDAKAAAVQAEIAAAGRGLTYQVSAAATTADRFRQVRITAALPNDVSGPGRVHITVHGRTGSAQADAPVALPTSARATAPRFGGRLWLFGGLAALALGLVVLVFMVADAPSQARRRRQRQDIVTRYAGGRRRPTGKRSGLRATSVARGALEIAGRVTARSGLDERLARRLDAAAVPFAPNEWLLLSVGVAVGTGVLVTLVSRNPLVGLLIGLVAGLLGPHLYLSLKAGRRRAAFAADLPEALQLMAGGLSSGYSLPQAVDSVVRLGDGVVAAEFGRALAQARLGTPVEDALDQVADRVDGTDLRWVIMAIRIQHRVGGNLSEVLTQVAETIRERAWLRRHVRGLSAEGRLSAIILGCLPILMGGYMFLVRRDYIRPLYTKPAGLLMLGGATALLIAGAFWMRKLVKVEL